MSHSPDSPSTSFLRALPKCEMHMHIEGSLEPDLLFQLSKKNNVALPAADYTTIESLEERYNNFTSLDDFLRYYNMAMDVLVTTDDFAALAYAYMTRANADGTAHAEIFFDPQAHTGRGIALASVVDGLQKGLKRGEKEFGITTKLIMCFVRHLPVSGALEAVRSMVPYVESGDVVGLGMDSTEKGNPAASYKAVYDLARELGYPNLTAHLGEEGAASEVRAGVETLGVRRVDHGIHAADDPEVLKLLVKEKVFVTVCPISNVRLRCVTEVAEVPILKFMEAGVKWCINSDDPAYFRSSTSGRGYLLDNYVAVHEAFGFTKEQWGGLAQDAIDGTWASRARKDELSTQLNTVLKSWEGKEI